MVKAAIYFETSVVSYLVARPSRDIVVAAHQQLTSDWWDNQSQQYDIANAKMRSKSRRYAETLVTSRLLFAPPKSWRIKHVERSNSRRDAQNT